MKNNQDSGPGFEEISADCQDFLEQLPLRVEAAAPLAAHGVMLATLLDSDPAYAELIHETATGQCDAGNFEQALPLALRLVAEYPDNRSYLFMAASCLQRLGQVEQAAALYILCDPEKNNAVIVFRIAECLYVLNKPEGALKLIEHALTLCGRNEPYPGFLNAAYHLQNSLAVPHMTCSGRTG